MGFWDQFWPQFVATLIGVGIGIPVALWIGSFQERREEKVRKEKILILLFDELEQNHMELKAWMGLESGDLEAGTLGSKLKVESWRAFSEGGELEWIKDPAILSETADAYYRIGAIKSLSEKYYSLIVARKSLPVNLKSNVYELLKQAVKDADMSICAAKALLKDDFKLES